MDDLLVIKSIPLSKETILWFEFLLNPNLLQTHLEKQNPGKIAILNFIKSLFNNVLPFQNHHASSYSINS